jgi:trans-aconitate methyltransferase
MATRQQHWDEVWRDRAPDDVSWFQAEPSRAARLVEEVCPERDAPVLDVGGGASRLVDLLLDRGYTDLTVLDLAADALAHARQRLADRAGAVRWITADVTTHRVDRPVAVWHDRAVFHFLTDEPDRRAYVDRLATTVRPGGHAIIATFAADGPEQCSGLPVRRHDPDDLAGAVGDAFTPVRFEREMHMTPWDTGQAFTIGVFTRR